jgi:hypothetical protein
MMFSLTGWQVGWMTKTSVPADVSKIWQYTSPSRNRESSSNRPAHAQVVADRPGEPRLPFPEKPDLALHDPAYAVIRPPRYGPRHPQRPAGKASAESRRGLLRLRRAGEHPEHRRPAPAEEGDLRSSIEERALERGELRPHRERRALEIVRCAREVVSFPEY